MSKETAIAPGKITLTLGPCPIDANSQETFARLCIKDGVAYLTQKDCLDLAQALERRAKQM